MQTIDELIGEGLVFRGMSPEALELLCGCGSNVRFTDGERLLREGEEANVFYVIRHGRVSLEAFDSARGAVSIETIGEGEVLGWSWLFPPYRWHLDARAIGLVRATRFDAACLREKCEQDPTFGYDLMSRFAQVLIERLESTQLRLLDVYGNGR